MKKRIKLMNKYFRKPKGKPKKEVQDLINADVENALQRATKLINNKNVAEPLILRTADTNTEDLRYRLTRTKKGENFLVEYDNTLLTAIFLGEQTLNYYQVLIDHVTGELYDDVVGEVNYKDITNTELAINHDRDERGPVLSTVTFDLHLNGSGTLSFDLRNHYAFDEERYLNILT